MKKVEGGLWQTTKLKTLIEEEKPEQGDQTGRKKVSGAFGYLGKCQR